MALYNSINITMLSSTYDFEVNRSFKPSISSEYQEGSKTFYHDIYSAIAHVFFLVVIMAPGVFINMKFQNNIKHEERREQGKTLHRIMKNHSITQMICWPSFAFLAWLFKVDQSIFLLLPPCFYHYVERILVFTYRVFRLYIGFNSVVVAICRICFLVYEHRVSYYGINKFRKIIYWGSILVPLVIVILAEGTIPIQPTTRQLGEFLPTGDSRCIGAISNINDTKMEDQSPVYAFVQNNISSYITISVEVVCYIVVFIILSNTIEAIIYWYTWSDIKRSDNQVYVRNLLSEESKRKRQRSNTINIKMTFISWSLEFIAGFCYLPIRFAKNQWVVRCFGLADLVFNFILIPMSYVLHNDVNKAIIVAEGWVLGFRRLINREPSNDPEQNNEVENPVNPNPLPVPIPTISRNISELENRGRRHGNNVCQRTSIGMTAQQLDTVADSTEHIASRRYIDCSESNQILPEEAGKSSSNNRADLEDEADGIETIPLDDIGEYSGQICPSNSRRAPVENAWV